MLFSEPANASLHVMLVHCSDKQYKWFQNVFRSSISLLSSAARPYIAIIKRIIILNSDVLKRHIFNSLQHSHDILSTFPRLQRLRTKTRPKIPKQRLLCCYLRRILKRSEPRVSPWKNAIASLEQIKHRPSLLVDCRAALGLLSLSL